MVDKKIQLTAGIFILLSVLAVLLVLPIVIAAPIYKQNSTVNLKVPCTNNGTSCSEIATCNITVLSPNETLLVNNKNMTRNISTYNYTLNYSKTVELGDYRFTVTCTDGADSAASSLTFKVTNSGVEADEAGAETITRGIYVLLVISVLFFIGFYLNKDPTFRWTFFLIGFMFLIVTLNLVSLSIHNYSMETDIFNVFDKIGAISYYMIWFIGGLLLMIWVLKVLASLAERRNMAMAQRVGSPMSFG